MISKENDCIGLYQHFIHSSEFDGTKEKLSCNFYNSANIIFSSDNGSYSHLQNFLYGISYKIMELLSKKFLILLEIATGDYFSLNQIAEKVGITKQGVSEYLKKMKEEGLIEVVDKKYRATVKGIEYLFSKLAELDKYLEEKRKKLNIIECCPAIAGDDIEKGDRVYLFMENGYLYAYKRKRSSAMAEAIESARKEEVVGIKGVKGIIELKLGKIHLFALPSIIKGTKALNLEKLKKEIEKINANKFGVLDVVGKVALDKIGIKCDIEFSPLQSAIEASQRGLNVVLLGEEKEIKYAKAKLDEYNANALEEIEYELHFI